MKMKKFISILSVLALLMGLFTSCGRSDEERSKILKIYNWGDYIDEDVLTDFPKWYKAVSYTHLTLPTILRV